MFAPAADGSDSLCRVGGRRPFGDIHDDWAAHLRRHPVSRHTVLSTVGGTAGTPRYSRSRPDETDRNFAAGRGSGHRVS